MRWNSTLPSCGTKDNRLIVDDSQPWALWRYYENALTFWWHIRYVFPNAIKFRPWISFSTKWSKSSKISTQDFKQGSRLTKPATPCFTRLEVGVREIEVCLYNLEDPHFSLQQEIHWRSQIGKWDNIDVHLKSKIMTQKISVIQRFTTVSAGCPKPFLKARVHRQFLSQQLNVSAEVPTSK